MKSLPSTKRPLHRPARVDLFIDGGGGSVGIEVKMNYDNFKGKGTDAETAKLSRKFKAMSRDHSNHVNVLVVIQGQRAYKGTNKFDTLARLRRERADFGLMYYDEYEARSVGPLPLR